MTATYRDPTYAAALRIEELRERDEDLSEDVPREIIELRARRVARTTAGAIAITGFVGMTLMAILKGLDLYPARGAGVLTACLVGTALLVPIGYTLAKQIAARTFERRVRASFDGADDALSRLARLEDDFVRKTAARLASEGERASIALPMMGMALLAPLTIHFAVWALLVQMATIDIGVWERAHEFDWWIAASLALVGIAHVVLAALAFRFATKVSRASLAELARRAAGSGWSALLWTFLAAFVPGLIALAIPPFVVLLTGLLFIPAMWNHMYGRAIEERQVLGLA